MTKQNKRPRLGVTMGSKWVGFLITSPITDRLQFSTLLGTREQVAIWIDGRLVHANGFPDKKKLSHKVDLSKNHPHRLRIEYLNPDGPAELKLLWASRITDLGRIPLSAFRPN